MLPPGLSSPWHDGLWLKFSSQFCLWTPLCSPNLPSLPNPLPFTCGSPASRHPALLHGVHKECGDKVQHAWWAVTEEEWNIKVGKNTEVITCIVFSYIFILLELQDFCLHLKKVKKPVMKMIPLLGGYTDSPLSPVGWIDRKKFTPLNATKISFDLRKHCFKS